MSEKRFFYDIDKGKLYNCLKASHAEYYHNAKLKNSFDDYIRLILANDTVFIRVFYPYNDINQLNYKALMAKSRQLITLFKKDIVKALKKQEIYFNKIKINATNETLKQDLKTCFV